MSADILVGADGSEAGLAAIRWAAEAATVRSARLRLVSVIPKWAHDMPDDGLYAEVGQWAREDALTGLDRARSIALHHNHELAVQTDLLPGDAKEVLVSQAASADLVVVGTRGSGGFVDLVVGSVALTVAAKSGKPTVVVRHWNESHTTRRISVAVDLTELNESVVEFAGQEAERRGASLQIVAAVRRIEDIVAHAKGQTLSDEDGWYLAQGAEGPGRVLATVVDGLTQRHPAVEITTAVRGGHPVTILGNASERTDLMVIGQRRVGRATPWGLGSVTRGVLSKSSCPVLIVPPDIEA